MHIDEIYCKDAKEFIEYLRPSNNLWKGSLRSWIFRGQQNSKWGLIPSIFRANINNWPELTNSPFDDINKQIDTELDLIRRFVKGADEIGLRIPGDTCVFRLMHSFEFSSKWPRIEDIEILAIAQHHGVPTRLLDFTHDGLTAAHFALSDAYEELIETNIITDNNLAVWAFSIDNYWKYTGIKKKLQIVSVPSSGNEFLFKQKGIFIFDQSLNHIWWQSPNEKLNHIDMLNTLKNELAEFYKRADNPQICFIRKIILPKQEAAAALKDLYHEGLSHAYFRPTYEWVVRTMRMENKLGLRRT